MPQKIFWKNRLTYFFVEPMIHLLIWKWISLGNDLHHRSPNPFGTGPQRKNKIVILYVFYFQLCSLF